MEQHTIIDVETWERKAQYTFFMEYDDPTTTITAEVDVTALLNSARENKQSFFLLSLLASSRTVNEIPQLKMRLLDQTPVLFDTIHARSTVARKEGGFYFCSFDFIEDKSIFLHAGKQKINAPAPDLLNDFERINTVFYTVMPWIRFTSVQHAFKRSANNSIPKIAFGKYTLLPDGRYTMPVALTVHHAFADGEHMAAYFHKFEENCKKVAAE